MSEKHCKICGSDTRYRQDKLDADYCTHCKWIETVNINICCDTFRKHIFKQWNNDTPMISVNEQHRYVYLRDHPCSDFGSNAIEINYCPFCGKKVVIEKC